MLSRRHVAKWRFVLSTQRSLSFLRGTLSFLSEVEGAGPTQNRPPLMGFQIIQRRLLGAPSKQRSQSFLEVTGCFGYVCKNYPPRGPGGPPSSLQNVTLPARPLRAAVTTLECLIDPQQFSFLSRIGRPQLVCILALGKAEMLPLQCTSMYMVCIHFFF